MPETSQPQHNEFPWLKLFFVPFVCYAPAFVLVFISLWFFRPANTSQSASNSANSVVRAEKFPDLEETINNLDTSPLARDYIKAAISNEVKVQVDQALPGEVENLKMDWKENLSSQVAFPILFTIAAIFAAFAVKDVLTEILKSEEKRNVKEELSIELRTILFGEFREQLIKDDVKPEINREHERLETTNTQAFDRIHKSLDNIITKIRWLEYEALDLTTSHLLSLAVSTDREEYTLPNTYLSEVALENSLRSISILNQLHNLTGQGEKINLLIEYERRVLDEKINSSNLDANTREDIRAKLEKIIKGEESDDSRDISDVRLFQLLEVLYDILYKTELDDEREKTNRLINKVYEVDNYLVKYQRQANALTRVNLACEEEEEKIFEETISEFELKDEL